MEYSIGVVYLENFNQYCLMIIDTATGNYLTAAEYENWIRHIGGIEIPKL